MRALYVFLFLLPLTVSAQIDKEIEEEVFRHQKLIRSLQKTVDSLRHATPSQKMAIDPVMSEDFVGEVLKIRADQKAQYEQYRLDIKRMDSLVIFLAGQLGVANQQIAQLQKVGLPPNPKTAKSNIKATPADTTQYAPGQYSSYPASSEMYKLMYGGQKLKPHPAPERDPSYVDYDRDQLLPSTLKEKNERKEEPSTPSNYGYTPSTGATIHTGPRGGRYYINSNGNKVYIKKK